MMDKQNQKELERLRQELARCKASLAESRLYRTMADHSQVGIFVHKDGKIIYANEPVARVSGFSIEELKGTTFLEKVHPEDQGRVMENAVKRLRGEEAEQAYEFRVIHKNGQIIWVRILATAMEHEGETVVFGNLVDVTDKNREKASLIQEKQQLSEKVKKKGQDLERRTRELEAVNDALHKLSIQARRENELIKERLVKNVRTLVAPHLDRLSETELGEEQQVHLDILNANLERIVAPFVQNITTLHPQMTPREIEVANLIREGKTSKQIATAMGVTRRAVEFHRNRIREKLGLKKTRKNLRSHLNMLA